MTDALAPGAALSVAALDVPLEPATVDAAGPRAGLVSLATLAGFDVGVWEHTAGTSTDVEEDEVSVVLSGSATIRFEDGAELAITAGDVLRLASGMRTTWTIHDTLRKVYVSPAATIAPSGA